MTYKDISDAGQGTSLRKDFVQAKTSPSGQ